MGFQQYVQVKVSPRAMLLSLRKWSLEQEAKLDSLGIGWIFQEKKVCVLEYFFLFFHEVI